MQVRSIVLDDELVEWYDSIEDGLKSRTVREVLKLGIKAKADRDTRAEGVL